MVSELKTTTWIAIAILVLQIAQKVVKDQSDSKKD